MVFFFLMIRPPPRSTQSRSSAASDVYKRQDFNRYKLLILPDEIPVGPELEAKLCDYLGHGGSPVSYTHLRAHETVLDLVCRLLLEKKKPE